MKKEIRMENYGFEGTVVISSNNTFALNNVNAYNLFLNKSDMVPVIRVLNILNYGDSLNMKTIGGEYRDDEIECSSFSVEIRKEIIASRVLCKFEDLKLSGLIISNLKIDVSGFENLDVKNKDLLISISAEIEGGHAECWLTYLHGVSSPEDREIVNYKLIKGGEEIKGSIPLEIFLEKISRL